MEQNCAQHYFMQIHAANVYVPLYKQLLPNTIRRRQQQKKHVFITPYNKLSFLQSI